MAHANFLRRVIFRPGETNQAKIAEKAVTPNVSILDRAYPPDLAIKPQKRKIVIFTFLISLIFAIFLVLVLNYLENLRNNSPEDYARFRLFYGALFGWLPGIKKTIKRGS